jgi:hypothetical protein
MGAIPGNAQKGLVFSFSPFGGISAGGMPGKARQGRVKLSAGGMPDVLPRLCFGAAGAAMISAFGVTIASNKKPRAKRGFLCPLALIEFYLNSLKFIDIFLLASELFYNQ